MPLTFVELQLGTSESHRAEASTSSPSQGPTWPAQPPVQGRGGRWCLLGVGLSLSCWTPSSLTGPWPTSWLWRSWTEVTRFTRSQGMRPACTGGSPAGHLWGFTRPGAPGPLRLARPSSVPHFVLQPQAPPLPAPSQAQPARPTDPSVPNLACSRVLHSSCKPVVHSTGPSPSSAEPSLLSVPRLRACSLQACPQSTQAQDRGQGRSQPLASGRPSAPTRCPEACPPPSWVGRGPVACEGRAWTAGVLSWQRAELPVPGPVRAAPRPGGRAGQRAPGVRGQRQQHTQRRRHAHLRGKAGCTGPPRPASGGPRRAAEALSPPRCGPSASTCR